MLSVYIVLGLIIFISLVIGIVLVFREKKNNPHRSFGEDPNVLFEVPQNLSKSFVDSVRQENSSISEDEIVETEPFVAREGLSGVILSDDESIEEII